MFDYLEGLVYLTSILELIAFELLGQGLYEVAIASDKLLVVSSVTKEASEYIFKLIEDSQFSTVSQQLSPSKAAVGSLSALGANPHRPDPRQR